MSNVERIIDLEWRRTKHRDGIWWYEAPIPPRWHRCTPWTHEYDASLRLYWLHCACGATSREGWVGLFGRMWLDRNARRRDERAKEPA